MKGSKRGEMQIHLTRDFLFTFLFTNYENYVMDTSVTVVSIFENQELNSAKMLLFLYLLLSLINPLISLCTLLDLVLGSHQKKSGLTPGSVLRDHSWWWSENHIYQGTKFVLAACKAKHLIHYAITSSFSCQYFSPHDAVY